MRLGRATRKTKHFHHVYHEHRRVIDSPKLRIIYTK